MLIRHQKLFLRNVAECGSLSRGWYMPFYECYGTGQVQGQGVV
jgi:hypothetical protein